MTGLQLPLTDPAYVFVVLFAVILLAPLVAERAGMPGIIGLILAGVVIGPNATGVLERAGPIEVLGGLGLLYLMFVAGLELDLDGFQKYRRDSIVFGATTFVLPMAINTAVGVVLGLGVLGSLLIASAFTSHTLVAYPVVRRFGLGRNRAVTATLGATLLATVAALLVLAIVAAAHPGNAGPWFWVLFVLGLTAFHVLTLWGLPRLTRWFFAGLGQDRTVRFTFVLVAVFGVSALADLAGIEAIVGAFLAGLALNRFVPEGSVLMERLQFLGSTFLIPLFLVSTGMLIDPMLVTDPDAMLLAGGLAAAAFGSKWLAVLPAAWLLGFDRAERGVMTGLSGAQAAGALAAAIVGVEIGLIGEDVVNAVVLVILATCLASTQLASRAAPNVSRTETRPVTLGQAVVVPVANPRTAAPLVQIAALVAGPDSGSVLPVNILGFDATREQVAEHKEITSEAEQVALRNGAEAQALVRIDASPTAGVLHTVVEGGGTSVLLGWKGYSNARENLFGGIIDAILSRSPVPVLVCRPGEDSQEVRRVVLSLTAADLAPAGKPGFELAADVASRIARQADVPLLVVTEADDRRLDERFESLRKVEVVCDERKPPIALREHTEEGDVVVIGIPPARPGLGQDASRLARAIPRRTVVATVPRLPG